MNDAFHFGNGKLNELDTNVCRLLVNRLPISMIRNFNFLSFIIENNDLKAAVTNKRDGNVILIMEMYGEPEYINRLFSRMSDRFEIHPQKIEDKYLELWFERLKCRITPDLPQIYSSPYPEIDRIYKGNSDNPRVQSKFLYELLDVNFRYFDFRFETDWDEVTIHFVPRTETRISPFSDCEKYLFETKFKFVWSECSLIITGVQEDIDKLLELLSYDKPLKFHGRIVNENERNIYGKNGRPLKKNERENYRIDGRNYSFDEILFQASRVENRSFIFDELI